MFGHIEMFYNLKRRHGNNNRLSPMNFERQHFNTRVSVEKVGCDSNPCRHHAERIKQKH